MRLDIKNNNKNMEIKIEDLTDELKKEVVSEHYRKMAKKSHKTIQEKYGKGYYRDIVKKRWDKDDMIVELD